MASMNQPRRSQQPEAWKPGDVVPESGIYAVIHWDRQFKSIEAIFIANQIFPPCKECGDGVRFQLLRTVPYILEDEDFNSGQS